MQASNDFVRIIVRRPHAYTFIEETFKERGGVRSATPAGCTLADGSTAPLPGVYFLDADGKLIDSAPLADSSAEDLLAVMKASAAK